MFCRAIVIGSGPAGLAAARALAARNIPVLVLERLDRPARKLLISGGGKCNFSNASAPEEFMRRFGGHGAFMRPSLRFAFREEFLDFLHRSGVKTELRDDFYYFPASGRASEVAAALVTAARAEIRTNCEVAAIVVRDGKTAGVILKNGDRLSAAAVILAAGGCAWAGLGTAAGLRLARDLGHTIVAPLPALAPLLCRVEWAGRLAGVTLPDAQLTLKAERHTLTAAGSVLFTHTGLSGGPALDLAGSAAAECALRGTAKLLLAFCRTPAGADWQKIFTAARLQTGRKSVRGILSEYLPRSVAGAVTELCGCPKAKAATLSAPALRMLTRTLTACPLTLTGTAPFPQAMAMRGGVSLKDVDPNTLQSRKITGLFFAGEILDLTGPCGGYNIQWAFSAGSFAGDRAASYLKTQPQGVKKHD